MASGTAVRMDLGVQNANEVDLPLDPSTLNERLMEVGLWLVEWQIPHQARVSMQPHRHKLRVSFKIRSHADAFRSRFCVLDS